jgi:hypothetical protein
VFSRLSGEARTAIEVDMQTGPMAFEECRDWLPPGRRAAVCFCIDDVHPAGSQDEFDAGGDLGRGVLGQVERLLLRHPLLRIMLFVTPDWRLRRLVPTRGWLTQVPVLRDCIHWAPLAPRGRFRLDRHPGFVAYLNGLPRTVCALHGLHHAHRGPRLAVEFQRQSRARCETMVRAGRRIFDDAGLQHVPGFAAPAWHTPAPLCQALVDAGFQFVSSARDLETPIGREARAVGSGLRGPSLLRPTWIRGVDGRAGGALVHFTTNFQATSSITRARSIIEAGGLLAIKAHIFKEGGGLTMLDGLDAAYCDYLGDLWTGLERDYGDSIWWTTFAEVAQRCRAQAA